jgi:gliding motility-associated protein GldM
MAGNKLPPRQKMIGMMYLVLTALLAMNVSKDILDAFIIVNDGLVKTSINFKDKIDAQHTAFEKAYQENKVKVGPYYEKAKRVEEISDELFDYINMVKANVIFQTEKLETIDQAIGKDANGVDTTISLKNIQSKDNYDVPTNALIGSEPGTPKEGEYTASELRSKLEGFRDELLTLVAPGSSLEASLQATFDFSERPDASGLPQNWESYNFYHTPQAATLTILSSIQTDVRNAESDLVKQLFANVDAGSFKFNKLEAATIAPTNYIIQGDSFRASVFLAAYDSTKNPEMLLGTTMDSATWTPGGDMLDVIVKDGKGRIAIKTGAEGEFTWKGVINFEAPGGKVLKYPFATTYTVAKPSLVVSADKMNVFYKGVDNPVSISVPGVSADKIKATISNGSLSRAKGGYNVRVSKGIEAIISVSAEMPDGTVKPMGKMNFRVKRIPDPVPYVAQKTGADNIKKVQLAAASKVFAKMENFDFDLDVTVKSYVFSMVVNGALVEKEIKGNRLDGQVKDLLKRARPGSKVYFEKIKVNMPGETVPRTLPPIILKLS